MRWRAGTILRVAGVLSCLGLAWPAMGWAAGEPSASDPTEATAIEALGGYGGPLTLGPERALWFTDGTTLGRIDAAGTLSEVPLSTSIGPIKGITAGREGDLWATGEGEVDRITRTGKVTRFPLPPENGETGSIATAKGGTLWLTSWAHRYRHERSSGKAYVIRMRPDGRTTSFPLPGRARARSEPPGSIVAGPGGDIWFTDPAFGRVGRFTPHGKLTEFHTRLRPQVLAPDGAHRLWLVGSYGVGTITTDGQVHEIRTGNFFELSIGSGYGAVAGPDGDLWFIGGATRVMRLTPTGQLNVIRGLGAPAANHIALGPGGSIWVSTVTDPIKGVTTAPLLRYQPGFPGVEVQPAIVAVKDGEVQVPLSCGGSSRGCSGEATMRFGHKQKVTGSYEVAAESEGTAKIVLPAGQRRLLAKKGYLRVPIFASVDGGAEGFTELVLRAPHPPAPRRGRPLLLPLPENIELDGYTRAPDGTIWAGGDIGRFNRITPAGHVSTLVVPGLDAEPVPIGFDTRGNLWFFEYHFEEAEPVIGRLSPGGQLSQVHLPPGPRPTYEAMIGPPGEIWVARSDFPHPGEIDRIGPGGKVSRFPIGVEPLAITAVHGGAWFSESGPRIGHISSNGRVRIFHIPHKGFVEAMALDRRGNVWFTHWSRRHLPPAIGRLSPDGSVVEYPVRHVGELGGITVKPNGDLSFTTEFPRGEGRMTPSGKVIALRRHHPPRGAHARTVALGGGGS